MLYIDWEPNIYIIMQLILHSFLIHFIRYSLPNCVHLFVCWIYFIYSEMRNVCPCAYTISKAREREQMMSYSFHRHLNKMFVAIRINHILAFPITNGKVACDKLAFILLHINLISHSTGKKSQSQSQSQKEREREKTKCIHFLNGVSKKKKRIVWP